MQRALRPIAGALLAAAALTANAWVNVPEAWAEGPCAHRSAEHAAQHHETREQDSHWHERHGDLPTCNLDKKDDYDDKSQEHDDPRWKVERHHEDKTKRDNDDRDDHSHRDHEGFHCYRLHCG